VAATPNPPNQVYTRNGAEHPYRMIVEAMREGAVVLTAASAIGYSNQSFAALLHMPLEEVIGCAMEGLVAAEDVGRYQALIDQGQKDSARGQISLVARAAPASRSISR